MAFNSKFEIREGKEFSDPYSLNVRDGVLLNVGNKVYPGVIDLSDRTDIHTIGDEAFAGCNTSMIILPNTAENLGNRCFADCKNIQEIRRYGGLDFKSIGHDLFDGAHQCVINIHSKSGLHHYFKTISDSPSKEEMADKLNNSKFADMFKDTPDTPVQDNSSAFTPEPSRSERLHNKLESMFKGSENYTPPVQHLTINDGTIVSHKGALVCHRASGTLEIPEGIDTIASGGLAYCEDIDKIVFPSTLHTVKDMNFIDRVPELDFSNIPEQQRIEVLKQLPQNVLTQLRVEDKALVMDYLPQNDKMAVWSSMTHTEREQSRELADNRIACPSTGDIKYDGYTGMANINGQEIPYDELTGMALNPNNPNEYLRYDTKTKQANRLNEKSFKPIVEMVKVA
jgi:hypothetical protein